jgi:hypothetical protein
MAAHGRRSVNASLNLRFPSRSLGVGARYSCGFEAVSTQPAQVARTDRRTGATAEGAQDNPLTESMPTGLTPFMWMQEKAERG